MRRDKIALLAKVLQLNPTDLIGDEDLEIVPADKKTTGERLKELMTKRNLKQVDILEKAKHFCNQYNIKLTKTDLSQYISGKVEPGQSKLFILGLALDVSEAWLMGFDVPMERTTQRNQSIFDKFDNLSTSNLERITEIMNSLNAEGQEKLIDLGDDLVQSGKYKKCGQSGMAEKEA